MAHDEDASCGQRCSQRLSNFSKFMCNTQEGTFIGRTGKSWALICAFYLVYYTLLAGFFMGMISVLLYGLVKEDEPLLTGKHSLLTLNPGLGMRPRPDVQRTLVKYNLQKPNSEQLLVKDLTKQYNRTYADPNKPMVELANCDLRDAQANKDFNPKEKVCKFNVREQHGPCTPERNFGYKIGKPCVIVKMNRLYGWLPKAESGSGSQHAMLDCYGENDGDKVNIGKVKYYPGTSVNGSDYGMFSSALFPYLNQNGYVPPTVAVQFDTVRRNVMVMVECRIKNIVNVAYDKMDRQAMVRFEVAVLDYPE